VPDKAQETLRVWEQPCGVLPVEVFPEQVEPHHLPWLVRIGYEKSKLFHSGLADVNTSIKIYNLLIKLANGINNDWTHILFEYERNSH
jgi:uncharacterized protein YmfQ (DUF2313 family)